jgi:uncharacterized LabA/DUF88 family protein
MQRVFAQDGELDFATMQRWFQSRGAVRRIFYYDCLRDIREQGETEPQFNARVQKQKDELEAIQALPGFHVHLGRLTGSGRNLRQKGVDVLLAVEMLDHAFRKNMGDAYLLAGDGDFVPLVEAVTRLGTWVEVFHDPRTASRELCAAADVGVPLSINDFWSWSTNALQLAHPLPAPDHNAQYTVDNLGPVNRREGTNEAGTRVTLGQQIDPVRFFLYIHQRGNVTVFRHSDSDILERYYHDRFGQIAWD